MALFQDPEGAKDRRAEADRIYVALFPLLDEVNRQTSNEKKSRETIEFIVSMRPRDKRSVSVKQLFWLRDLYEKYCL